MKPNVNRELNEKAAAMVRAMDETYKNNENICARILQVAALAEVDYKETVKVISRGVAMCAIIMTAGLFLNAAICSLVMYLFTR